MHTLWSSDGGHAQAKEGSCCFSLKSTDSLNVTPSHSMHTLPLIHKHTQLNSTFQLVFVHLFDFVAWSWVSPFGGSSGPSFWNQGTSTDPYSHHTSESVSCLLNTDTNPQTHTLRHTYTCCLPGQPPLYRQSEDWGHIVSLTGAPTASCFPFYLPYTT